MSIPIGTHVRIKPSALGATAQDPYGHMRRGDVGETVEPEPHHPLMARFYVIVRFPGCRSYHRFLENELEIAEPENGTRPKRERR